MTEITTRALEVPGAVLTYDIHQPDHPGDHPPLFIFGSPMGASGFEQLVSHVDDRTVVTYDPRMTERSHLTEGGEVTVEAHADDLHRVAEAVGGGAMDAFGSSGGATAALPWIVAYPGDLRTVVAHEPPLAVLLEDADVILKINADIVDTYQQRGFGPAMAKFLQLAMHTGTLPADYLEQPDPDPGQFGFPAEDDGSRACWARHRSSSPAITAALPPTTGLPTTIPPPSPPSSVRCWAADPSTGSGRVRADSALRQAHARVVRQDFGLGFRCRKGQAFSSLR